MNLDFLLFIYDYIQDNLSLVGYIITLVDLDISILETFIIKVFLGKNLGTVEHVWSHLCTLYHTQFLLHILSLALFQADIVDVRDTRANGQIDVEIKFFAHDRVGSKRHF